MTTVHTLASGSSGNALACLCGGTRILVDAGISCRRITEALAALGVDPAELDGVLITHTHADHISGLQTLLRRCPVPVFATAPALWELERRFPWARERFTEITPGEPFSLGQCRITPFPTAHDAPGSCGFRIDTPGGSLGILTDSGHITPAAAAVLPGVDLAVLEANHDPETLLSGPYPPFLKQRILGSRGHLSNEDAARFAVTLAESGTSEIVLAHLSRENNTPAMAHRAVETALAAAALAPALSVAPRDRLGPPHVVTRSAVCRR